MTAPAREVTRSIARDGDTVRGPYERTTTPALHPGMPAYDQDGGGVIKSLVKDLVSTVDTRHLVIAAASAIVDDIQHYNDVLEIPGPSTDDYASPWGHMLLSAIFTEYIRVNQKGN